MQIYLDSTICTIACNFIATHMETYLQPFNAYFFRMDYGYKLSCLLGFSINLLPIGHSGVHIGEEHLQCSWCCWTWFGCLTGIGLLVDWLVYWYWLVGWLVLVCWLVSWMPGVGWLADWLVFESGLSVRGRRSKATSLFLSLSQSPFYKYQFKDVNVLAEICKQ